MGLAGAFCPVSVFAGGWELLQPRGMGHVIGHPGAPGSVEADGHPMRLVESAVTGGPGCCKPNSCNPPGHAVHQILPQI